jgi:uncharacterized small protein (DUF1192 family)
MNRSTHPVEQEEVMAYLDGELEPQRAATVAEHLDDCADCQALAAQLRGVSQQMMAWQVEPSPARLAERVTAATEERPAQRETAGEEKGSLHKPHWPRWLMSRWTWALASTCVALLIIVKMNAPEWFVAHNKVPAGQGNSAVVDINPPPSAFGALRQERGVGGGGERNLLVETPHLMPRAIQAPSAGPMIARTASLTVVAKDFETARAAVERIVSQHQGYVANLTATAPKNAARTLTATLRIPAPQLDAALVELKALGRIEQETQAGEDVTKQYTDLVARLNNSRATEKRLVDILRQRPGKVSEVLEVEQEIARVREEIEQMEAERKNTEKRVQFAAVELKLSEEYKAQLEVTPPSTGTRLRNALVNGYRRVAESIFDLILFALDYGPSLFLWGLVLFWPARLAWRRWRTVRAAPQPSASV